MTVGSRENVRSLFQFEGTPYPLFIPLVGTFAAKLWQTPTKNLLTDATKLTNAIQKTCKLFQFDVVTIPFDLSLESEALGCKTNLPNNYDPPMIVSHPLGEGALLSKLEDVKLEQQGRIPIFVEVTRRLVNLLSKDRPIAAIQAGPMTLANNLRGTSTQKILKESSNESFEILDFTGRIALRMARTYCDLKVDIIIIAEQQLMDLSPENYEKYKESLTSIWNLVRFYQMRPLIFFLSGKGVEDSRSVFGLGADGVALGGINDLSQVKQMASEYKQCYAGCIPSGVMRGELGQLRQFIVEQQEYLKSGSRDGFFLTTEGDIPSATPPSNVKELLTLTRQNI